MEREICSLKAQLVDSQASVDSSVKEVEDLNSQLMTFNETLCKKSDMGSKLPSATTFESNWTKRRQRARI